MTSTDRKTSEPDYQELPEDTEPLMQGTPESIRLYNRYFNRLRDKKGWTLRNIITEMIAIRNPKHYTRWIQHRFTALNRAKEKHPLYDVYMERIGRRLHGLIPSS